VETRRFFAFLGLAALTWSVALAQTTSSPAGGAPPDARQVPIVLTGGYDTDPRDRGRPVILIAAALGVAPEVFRQAFSSVHPAHGNGGPTDQQARANKQVLMATLGPYGVTDDRLNEVSNYYRYRRESGELWRHTPAAGYATLSNGTVTSITITNPGSGYSSPPMVAIPGATGGDFNAILTFGKDMSKNGSIYTITVAK
jgi:hypothetical protein